MPNEKIINIARLSGRSIDCDCDEIERRLTELENNQWNCEKTEDCLDERLTNIENELIIINNRLTIVEQSVAISDVRSEKSTNQLFNGLGASVISIGPTYNYWGEGLLVGAHTWSQGGKYYLITVAQFPELAWYQGEATIGTVWFTGSSGLKALPIFVDSTGIYIQPTSNENAQNGTSFKFTLTLILIDPNQPTP